MRKHPATAFLMKLGLSLICGLFHLLVSGQKLEMPVKDDMLHYEDIILFGDSINQEKATANLEKWVAANQKNWKLQSNKSTLIGGTTFINGIIRVDPEEGDYRSVDGGFTITITMINDRLRYQINELGLIKAGQRFDATSVYKGYRKGEPFMQQKLEQKEAVLIRHEDLLRKFDLRIKKIIASLSAGVLAK
jgi:hypothetical protein